MLVPKNSNFTAESGTLYVVDTTAGNIEVTLPDAANDAAFYFHNAGINHIIYITQNNQTINGSTEFINDTINRNNRLFTDGSNWFDM